MHDFYARYESEIAKAREALAPIPGQVGAVAYVAGRWAGLSAVKKRAEGCGGGAGGGRRRGAGAASREGLSCRRREGVGRVWDGAGRRGGAGARLWVRMACTAKGSCTAAMTRSRPPQRGQARTSRLNTRRMSAVQVHARVGPAARGLASRSRASPSGAGRP
jgi:hypothetical protein